MRVWVLTLGFLGGCSFVDVPPAAAILLTDSDTSVFSAVPPPATLTIDILRDPNRRDHVAQGSMPSADNPRVNLQDPGVDFGTTAQFESTGFDANNNLVFRGTSIPLFLNGIDGIVLPLFVSRLGAWSRPPASLALSHVHPTLGFTHGYLVAAGGDAFMGADLTQVDLYDLAQWIPVTNEPAFPRAPRTMVIVQTSALLIDDAGAQWANFYTGAPTDAVAPSGTDAAGQPFSFAQVAGGDVVKINDDQYVVGATRAVGATNQILHVASDGTLTAMFLGSARTGAAAGSVQSTVYVAGGTTDAGTGGLLETCPVATGCSVPMGPAPEGGLAGPRYPPDTLVGFGIAEAVLPAPVMVDGGTPDMTSADGATTAATAPAAFLVGGVDPATGAAGGVRSFNPDCSDLTCSIATLATLPALTRTHAFFFPSTTTPQMVIVGETADGEDHAFLLDPLAATITPTELALRERRSSASVTLFPNGQVGIVGGLSVVSGTPATSIELFTLP